MRAVDYLLSRPDVDRNRIGITGFSLGGAVSRYAAAADPRLSGVVTVCGGGFRNDELRLKRSFGKSEVITDFGPQREGGHGGSDTSLQDLIFRNQPKDDPLGLRADLRAGALSSLIGVAAYKSIERGGQAVRINDLVKL